jgi:ankyrin repeat protein
MWHAAGSTAATLADIDAGSLNDKNGYGWTALVGAVFRNRLAVLEYLASHMDVDANAQFGMHGGELAVCFAAYTDDVDVAVLQFLISRMSADVNLRQGKDGWTALHCAAFRGRKDKVACVLKAASVDPSVRNADGLTAEELAVREELFEIASMISAVRRQGGSATVSARTSRRIP